VWQLEAFSLFNWRVCGLEHSPILLIFRLLNCSASFSHSESRQETIQEGEHCSVQDAAAAMRLLQLKLAKGLSYGVPTKEFVSIWETVRDKSGALIMTADLAEPLRAVTGEGIGAATLLNAAESAEEVLELAARQDGTLT
jgi:hypothetical protein